LPAHNIETIFLTAWNDLKPLKHLIACGVRIRDIRIRAQVFMVQCRKYQKVSVDWVWIGASKQDTRHFSHGKYYDCWL